MRVLYSFPTRLGTPGIGTTAWHQAAGLADQGVVLTSRVSKRPPVLVSNSSKTITPRT